MINCQFETNLKQNIKLLFEGLKLINRMSPYVTVLQLCNAVCKAIIPYIGIYMSTYILTELVTERNIQKLILYVSVTIGSTLLVSMLSGVLNYFIKIGETKIISKHEILLNNKTYSMNYARAEQKETNDLRSRIEVGSRAYSGGIRVLFGYCDMLFEGVISIVIAITLCSKMFFVAAPSDSQIIKFINSYWFSIILFLLIIVALAILCDAQIKTQKCRLILNRNMADSNLLADYYMESYFDANKAAKDIRIYNQAAFVLKEYYDNVLFPFWKNHKSNLNAEGTTKIKQAVITAGLGGIVYIYVALKAWSGAIPIGEVVRYYGAITQLFVSFSSFILAVLAIVNNNEYIKLLFSFLEMPEQQYTGNIKVPSKKQNLQIEFENVSFQYNKNSPMVLQNISLKLESGKKTAIVGMNGSGKTTLIKLLCRFYEPTCGVIKLNGIDIREYDYEEYKAIFSVVFQDFRLFSFTVGQNVAGSLTYDEQRVWKALELAGIKDLVDSFPKKLNQTLYKDYEEDGIDLSGGEEQKIALARAIYRDSPYVILDEPTSALDPFSEAQIYEKFNQIVRNKTAVYISHRLSSCKFCDQIVVFDKGKIVQMGQHEDLLLNVNGKYAELWNAQAQYYVN